MPCATAWLGPPAEYCWPHEVHKEDELQDPWRCVHVWELYVACLYFAMYTITSVGFGDIAPRTPAERVVCVLSMLGAGVLWGLVIATFSGVFATMDPAVTKFYSE